MSKRQPKLQVNDVAKLVLSQYWFNLTSKSVEMMVVCPKSKCSSAEKKRHQQTSDTAHRFAHRQVASLAHPSWFIFATSARRHIQLCRVSVRNTEVKAEQRCDSSSGTWRAHVVTDKAVQCF